MEVALVLGPHAIQIALIMVANVYSALSMKSGIGRHDVRKPTRWKFRQAPNRIFYHSVETWAVWFRGR